MHSAPLMWMTLQNEKGRGVGWDGAELVFRPPGHIGIYLRDQSGVKAISLQTPHTQRSLFVSLFVLLFTVCVCVRGCVCVCVRVCVWVWVRRLIGGYWSGRETEYVCVCVCGGGRQSIPTSEFC